MNFKTTTHDKIIHHAKHKGKTTHVLRQVNDFTLACDDKSTAIEMHNVTGAKPRSPKEDKDPFACLGSVKDFNGINTSQAKTHTKLSCSNHINRMMTSHGWDTTSAKDNPNTASPLRMDVLDQSAKHTDGPKEGTTKHSDSQEEQGFSHQSLLGEMMFACVSCGPDVGNTITLMSKHGSNPTKIHHHCLESTAKCLQTTKHWGITFTKKGSWKVHQTSPCQQCLKAKNLHPMPFRHQQIQTNVFRRCSSR